MTQPERSRSAVAADADFHLTRACELMYEIQNNCTIGYDLTAEIAPEQIALSQMLIAAANTHLRIVETMTRFDDWQRS